MDEPYEELYEAPGFVSKAVAFLGTWLLAPLTLIYAAIILAYGVKITLAGSLPKGEIAQLVTPFLIIGTLTWLLLEPPFVKSKVLANIFRKLWFPISIPAGLLLAIAVLTRVGEYGLTPERIALILAVLWAFGLGVWFSFGPKEKRDIRLIPALASALLTFGVFTAGWLSILNQSARLDSYLVAAGITAGMEGQHKDKEAAKNAKGAIEYLYRNDAKDRLKTSLAKVGYKAETVKLDDVYSSLALMGIQIPSRYHRANRDNKRYGRHKTPVDIQGYSTLNGRFNYTSNFSRSNIRNVTTIGDIAVRRHGDELIFSQSDAPLDINGPHHKFDVMQWMKSLPVDDNDDSKIALQTALVPLYSSADTQIAMIVESLNIWEDNDGSFAYILEYDLVSGPAQK